MWPLNAVQAGLAAVLPERVPVRRRGSISGIVGAAQMLGSYAGVAMAGLSTELFMGYLLVAASFLLVAQLFAFSTKDRPAPALDEPTTSASAGRRHAPLPGLRAAPDYWWAFAGRFLLIFGYFSVMSFQLYILRDHVGLGDVDAAARTLVTITGLSTVLGLVASIAGGWIADRIGRLRFFVGLSTALFVPAGIVYWLVPTMTGAWIATATMGIGFGMYAAVDAALISRVLPDVEDAGRDLGIMNIANAGPQIIAPAVAGAVVGATGSYAIVFAMLVVCSTLGALSVRFIKGVR